MESGKLKVIFFNDEFFQQKGFPMQITIKQLND